MSKQCPTPKGAQGQWPGQWMCICCFLVSAYTVIEPFLFPRHVYGCSMLHILCWEWWMRHWIALADSSFYTQGIAGWIYVCSADPVLKCFDLLWFHPYLQPYQSSFSFFLDSNSRLGHHQSEECRLITSIAVCRPSLRSWWEVKVKSCFFYTKSLQVVWQQVCSFARSFADFLSFTDRCHMMAVLQYPVSIQLFSLRVDSLAIALIAQALHGGDDRRFCEIYRNIKNLSPSKPSLLFF